MVGLVYSRVDGTGQSLANKDFDEIRRANAIKGKRGPRIPRTSFSRVRVARRSDARIDRRSVARGQLAGGAESNTSRSREASSGRR